jgi:hypothetical protein
MGVFLEQKICKKFIILRQTLQSTLPMNSLFNRMHTAPNLPMGIVIMLVDICHAEIK